MQFAQDSGHVEVETEPCAFHAKDGQILPEPVDQGGGQRPEPGIYWDLESDIE